MCHCCGVTPDPSENGNGKVGVTPDPGEAGTYAILRELITQQERRWPRLSLGHFSGIITQTRRQKAWCWALVLGLPIKSWLTLDKPPLQEVEGYQRNSRVVEWVSNCKVVIITCRAVRPRDAGPAPRVPYVAGLREHRISSSEKFPGDAAGQAPTFWELWSLCQQSLVWISGYFWIDLKCIS